MRERLTASTAMPILSWAGFLISVPGLIALVVASFAQQEWAALGAVLFALAVVVLVFVQLMHRHRPSSVTSTTIFRPFASLQPEQTWPRGDVGRLLEMIGKEKRFIPLVVGASGVGKSTLLDVMIRDRIKADWPDVEYTILSAQYSSLVDELRRLIAESSSGCTRVIVLDQFEQWLASVRPKSYEDRTEAQEKLRIVLQEAKGQPRCTVVISLRREWFFELRFLGGMIPSLEEVCEVQAPKTNDDKDPMRAGIRRSFIEVLGDDGDLVDAILERLSPTGRLSPLRAQIVGAVLERKVEAGAEIDEEYFDEDLGGVSGATDAYFKEVLEGAHRPDLCMKILFALSVGAGFRGKATLHMLAGSLYENADTMRTALDYLVKQRLVTKIAVGTYALTHDFVGEYFNAKSGLEMHPVERDNIQIYAAASGEHSPAVNSRDRGEIQRRRPFGMIVVSCLLVLMLLRFLYFGVDTTLVGPSVATPLAGSWFDAAFLPILIPYSLWICYCGLFYDRLVVHLRESRPQRILSVLIVLNLVVSVLLGIFIPIAWLIGIASGGLVFASKMLWLSRNSQISPSARERLKRFAMPTVGNLLIVAAVGVADIYFSVKYVQSGTDVNNWIWINLAVSFMITYSCLALAHLHVTRSAIAQLLGVIGRPGTVAHEFVEA
jgi:hypothetical protein